ncbi:MAG: gpW family head-tail joining protein [Oceanisphaera sp.]|uniref:gpW family head-tail joining protein n=1 Tax=Oceanisphaera sp. TaxID=1929979 RepID=UPI003C76DFCD
MAYTKEDLAQVRQAILDLASGTRVARIIYEGKTIEYSGSDLDKLVKLESQIATRVNATNARKRPRTRYVVTGKGL